MKKITLISLCLLSVITVKSQITITSADMPNANDSVLVSVTNSIGSLDATLTGTTFTWDFSSLVGTSQRYEKFDSPFNFSSIFALLFSILNTSYGKENRTLTSLPIPGVSFTAAYDFLKESTSQLKQVGAGYTINGTPLPFLYTSADVIYRFPMNYGNTDSSDYHFGLPIPTFGYYGETGHRVNTVDGWGTCITPFGSFPTLRVKSVITSTDTLFITAVGFGSNIPRPARVEYKWLASNKKIPVLEIDGNMVGGNPVITNVQYIDGIHSSAGIVENNLNNTHSILYPNPLSNNSTLYYQMTNVSPVKIIVTDVIGKTVATLVDEKQSAGNHQIDVNANSLNLETGIYFITVQTATYSETTKMIIEK